VDTDHPPDIVVIAGGVPIAADLLTGIGPDPTVIAADAGVGHALDLGWRIDVAVGDFDSLAPDLVDRLDDLAGEVQRHPTDKDATDLDLALAHAVASAPARVLVTGVEGGRPDHALANLLLVASERFAALDIEVVLERGRAWVVRDELCGALPGGSVVSLVPLHGAATASITGVRWPLHRHRLEPGTTHGISNETTGGPFRVDVDDGVVLCIAPRSHELSPRHAVLP
jgi:thiamine pyrophosphokinase